MCEVDVAVTWLKGKAMARWKEIYRTATCLITNRCLVKSIYWHG